MLVATWAMTTIVATICYVATVTSPARATIEADDLGCRFRATIIAEEVGVVRIDGDDAAARLPSRGSISWQASSEVHAPGAEGSLELLLGPWGIQIERWGPMPADRAPHVRGYRAGLGFGALMPTGTYQLQATHRSSEGACSGTITLVAGGYGFGAYMSLVAMGALISFLLLLRCGRRQSPVRRGRPLLGGFTGLALGGFVAAALFMLHAFPSDSRAFVNLPLTLMLLGATLGIVAPLGRSTRPASR